MSAHPGASFTWNLRNTVASAMHIGGKKLCVILHRLLQGIFALTNVANGACTASYTMLMVTWCLSECCVPVKDSTSKPLVVTVPFHLSNYLIQGHQVTVNMTWAPFRG